MSSLSRGWSVSVLLVWGLTAAPLLAAQAQRPSAADTLAVPQKPAPRLLLTDSLRPAGPSRYQRLTASPVFRRTVVPGALLTLAVLGTRKVNILGVDEPMRRGVQSRFPTRTEIDDQLRHVPVYASIGLSLAGVKGRHSTLNQALLFGLAYSINNAVSGGLKQLTRVERPKGNNSFDSFPSLHTSAAFSAARVLDKEYGGRSGWYSVGGYTVATATAGLRITNDAHWLSDVMAGAGVGLLSTELAYWVYPWLHRQLLRGLGDRAVVLPMYLNGTVGATAVVLL